MAPRPRILIIDDVPDNAVQYSAGHVAPGDQAGSRPPGAGTHGKITLSGKNLLVLLNDILDLSRLEANQFQIETMDFDLQTAVDACLGLVRARAHNKGLALALEIEPAVPADLATRNARHPTPVAL